MIAESARLFVGIELPAAVRQALSRIQPAARDGLRPVALADMHITLHFIGYADIQPVIDALGRVGAPRLHLALTEPGVFRMQRGRHIFWMGVEPSPALLNLHRAVGDALAATGFVPETRRFSPHITLARLGPKAAAEAADAFCAASLAPDMREFDSERFSLFSSDTSQQGARYSVIESWSLAASG